MDTGDTMFREWDLYDRIGRGNYMRHREVSTALREALAGRVQPLRVLDLGCGDGWMSQQVLAGSRVAGYVGVDLSEAALARHAVRPGPGTQPSAVERRLLCGDVAGELHGLPDRSFDIVLAGYVLHHFRTDEKPRVLDQIVRVLDAGGWLLWTDLVRAPGQPSDDLLRQIADDIATNWSTLAPEERRSAIEHMEIYDFPEPEPWMIDQLQRRGAPLSRWLFRDAYYGTALFEKAG